MIIIISDISHDNHFYQQDIENRPDFAEAEEAFAHLNTPAEVDEDATWMKSGEDNQ